MNKTTAKKIAETVTNDQIQEMFDNAKANITDWTEKSSVNNCMTKGTSWNILYGAFKNMRHGRIRTLGLTNMIREFGDFIDGELVPNKKKSVKVEHKITHQEPIF